MGGFNKHILVVTCMSQYCEYDLSTIDLVMSKQQYLVVTSVKFDWLWTKISQNFPNLHELIPDKGESEEVLDSKLGWYQ